MTIHEFRKLFTMLEMLEAKIDALLGSDSEAKCRASLMCDEVADRRLKQVMAEVKAESEADSICASERR